MLESSLIKLDAQNCNFIKEDSNTEFLLWILWIIQKHLFCVEDLWTAGSETPLHLFKNTFFTKHHQWLLLTVSGFQPAALLKKGLQQGRFSDNFKKHLFTENLLSDHLFYWGPLENCLFHVQVAEFQPPDTIKRISQVLLKHFIQKRDLAIRRRSLT